MNAISNIPLNAKVILLVLAIVSLWLFSGEKSENENQTQHMVSRTSDYGMTNFTMTIMDKQGKPARIITGSEMAHYPEDDSTEVISPVAHFLDQENDTWLVISDKGTTQGKAEDIFLTGNVIITRQESNDIELRTETLHIDTKYNTAYTDDPVELTSPNGVTNSVGLHAALEDETINLHSRVRGHYDAPPTN